MDKYGWADAAVTRSNVSCFACEFVGAGEEESRSTLTRLGEALLDPPVLFNLFAADEDPVLRRVSCLPGLALPFSPTHSLPPILFQVTQAILLQVTQAS